MDWTKDFFSLVFPNYLLSHSIESSSISRWQIFQTISYKTTVILAKTIEMSKVADWNKDLR